MIKVVLGDILESPLHYIIIQQVNCRGKMGAGVAKVLGDKYPKMKAEFVRRYEDSLRPEEQLGDVFVYEDEIDKRVVYNIYSQLDYGKNKQHTNYKTFEEIFLDIASYHNFEEVDAKFAIPWGIGCGLGGGDFNKIYDIIEKTLAINHEVIFFKHNSNVKLK